jgi:hypothetical protein
MIHKLMLTDPIRFFWYMGRFDDAIITGVLCFVAGNALLADVNRNIGLFIINMQYAQEEYPWINLIAMPIFP